MSDVTPQKLHWREIAEKDWTLGTPYQLATIHAAAAIGAYHEAKRAARTLERIENHLLGLGRDGLHVVLREQAYRARRAAETRRARQRAKRERLAKKKAKP